MQCFCQLAHSHLITSNCKYVKIMVMTENCCLNNRLISPPCPAEPIHNLVKHLLVWYHEQNWCKNRQEGLTAAIIKLCIPSSTPRPRIQLLLCAQASMVFNKLLIAWAPSYLIKETDSWTGRRRRAELLLSQTVDTSVSENAGGENWNIKRSVSWPLICSCTALPFYVLQPVRL